MTQRTITQSLDSILAASRAWTAQNENREDYERNERDIIAVKHHLTNPPDTLRDELAGHALSGALASLGSAVDGEGDIDRLCTNSYYVADQMLKARKT